MDVKRFFRRPLFLVLAAIIILGVLLEVTRDTSHTTQSTAEVVSRVQSGEGIKSAVLVDTEQQLRLTLADDTKVQAYYAYGQSTSLANQLQKLYTEKKIERFDVAVTGGGLAALLQWVPILLVILFFIFFLRMMQSGGGRGVMSFAKSRAKLVTKDTPKTTFADVAGADEALEELAEIKEFLSEPGKFQAVGAKIPKGVLLYGQPGTGKTLLARAVAGEAGVPFYSISGSDFVEMFVGVGASRVRDLFEQAKANAPAIVFIDEIDAVGRHRGAGMGGGHDEREQTLNQLLVEMDGFDVRGGVILIAATNRPDVLDPALLRPGRFDRQIAVDAPDLNGRTQILKVHARGKPIDAGVDLAAVARRTPGFTGADLANMLNEAALLAARNNRNRVGPLDMDEAIDRVIAGPQRRSRPMSDKEKVLTAYHEGGHALVAAALPHSDPVHKVTILPRGRALGYTMVLPDEDKYSTTRSEMLDKLAYMMGGRAAEEMVFHDPTTGASNDIEKATALARSMVTEYGMTERLGAVKFGETSGEPFLGRDLGHQRNYSEEVAGAVDEEVAKLISNAHQEAFDILVENRAVLDELVRQLLEKETLDKSQVAAVFKPVVRRPLRPAWTGSDSRVPSSLPPVQPVAVGAVQQQTPNGFQVPPGSYTPPVAPAGDGGSGSLGLPGGIIAPGGGAGDLGPGETEPTTPDDRPDSEPPGQQPGGGGLSN